MNMQTSFKKFFTILLMLILTVNAGVTVSAAKNDEAYEYMSCQYYYGKPYIFYIGMNTSDKVKKSHDSINITLSDKTNMTVWYEEDLKADIKDKAVTAALAEALVSCKKNNDEARYPIIIGMENVGNNTPEQLTGQYYKDDNIGYFSAVFPLADKQTQASYLKKAYDDDKAGFFSVALDNMNSIGVTKRYGGKAYAADNIGIFSICLNTLEDRGEAEKFADIYAEKAFTDGKLDFFSVLSGKMDDKTLKKWYDRAEKDGKASFMTICGFDNDDRDYDSDDWEFWDNWDTEFEFGPDSETLKEYEKYGVTFKDRHYFYNGEPVRYFLDIQIQRSDSSFMAATVETNPKGKPDIKIVRDKNGNVTGAEKLTEKEIKEYFGD